jgi:hypothetical protein
MGRTWVIGKLVDFAQAGLLFDRWRLPALGIEQSISCEPMR